METINENPKKTDSGQSAGQAGCPRSRTDAPFIFISYAYTDAKLAFPEIRRIYEQGYPVWYSEDDPGGGGQADDIARAIEACTLFVVLLTPDAAASQQVQNEINYAVSSKKPFLAIHLKQTSLSGGLKLQIGTKQAIHRYSMSEEEYAYKYTAALQRLFTEGGELSEDSEAGARPPQSRKRRTVPVICGAALAVIALALLFLFTQRNRTDNTAAEAREPAAELTDAEIERDMIRADSFSYILNGDHAEIVALHDPEGVLMIPAEIDGLPVTVIRGLPSRLGYNTSLTGLELPYCLTEIGDYAFCNCISLTGVTVPEGVTRIGAHAFDKCSSLQTVSLPDGLTEIGDYAFYSCTALGGVSLPEGLSRIGDYAFYSCAALENLELPDSVTELGEAALGMCSRLTSVKLSSGLSELKSLTFYYDYLRALTFPESITRIEADVFSVGNIKKIDYSGTKEQWNAIETGPGNDILRQTKVVYGR